MKKIITIQHFPIIRRIYIEVESIFMSGLYHHPFSQKICIAKKCFNPNTLKSCQPCLNINLQTLNINLQQF